MNRRRLTRPRVIVKCVADSHVTGPERIIEFASRCGGGLISFRENPDGTLQLSVYCRDKTVAVSVGTPKGA